MTTPKAVPLLLLLSALCAPAAPPTPESHFGFPMGADRRLASWSQVVTYFQALERSSDRIKVRELGKTTEGRPFIAAWISSPENLAQLEQLRLTQQRLADPRQTTEADAARLIAAGKAVVLVTCSIHSNEVGSTYTAAEYAYRLLTQDTAKHRAILDNVILILVPSLNPDGVDIIGDWYRSTLNTPYEGVNPPRLYQKYVGHDNNRDWYFFTQAETRLTISQLHNVWHPQIVYDVHQQGQYASRMFVPPWLDPIEPNVDPIIAQTSNAFGTGIAMDLTAAGKKGVALNAVYDFWSPSRHFQAYHGGLRLLSESASARLATPIQVQPSEITRNALGYNPQERSWNYLEPWLGGDWRMRDIIDYQLIAFESVLYQAATRREDLLRNFYSVGKKAVARTIPSAFLVPIDQTDPGAARKLLDTLAFGQVEIERGPTGYVIRMNQPYSAWAKTLLERQEYPDLRQYPGGPPKRPYDVTAHTLPLLLGVDVQALDTAPPSGEKVRRFVFPPSRLAASDSDTWRAVNRIWNTGASVWREAVSGEFSQRPQPGWVEKKRPRVGIYRSYVPAIDEGWTRWTLEQFGFSYRSLSNADIIAGKLRDHFDAIIFPDEPPATIYAGYRPGEMPPEYVGGLGEPGARTLIEFANEGGTLIFLNDSTAYGIGHLGLPLRSVTEGIADRDFYCPGSLLRVTLDEKSPLAYGLPKEIAIWSEQSPAWNVVPNSQAKAVARYTDSNVLASGWLLGERYIAGRVALADVPVGKGRAILFGMRPQYRGQSYQAMKLLFNALLL